MIIEMLTLVALVQAPAAGQAPKAKPPPELTEEDAKLIDALVKQVVSGTRPTQKPQKAAASRPARERRAKGKVRVGVNGRAKPTSRPISLDIGKRAAQKRATRSATGKKIAPERDVVRKVVPLGRKAAPAKPKAKPVARSTQKRPSRARVTDRSDLQRVRGRPKTALIRSERGKRRADAVPSTLPAIEGLEGLPEMSQLRGRVEIDATGPDTVILQGDEEAVAALESIIRILDATQVPLKLEVYQLQNAQARLLAPMLGNLLNQAFRVPGRRARPSDQVVVLPDARSNSLLIGAAAERMDEIHEIIEKLDSQPLIGPVTFKTFPLKHMKATDASTLLEQMISRLQAQRGVPGEAITIIPDDRTNTLIVTAPEADLKQVAQMIGLIDVEPVFATATMVYIPLKNADAQPLATVLNDVIDQRLAGRRGRALTEQIRRLRLRTGAGEELPELDLEKPIKVAAETGTNALLIGSTEQNLVAMEEMVKLLDSVPISEKVEIRIFPLQDADANDLLRMIQQIFTQGQRLSAGPGGRQRGRATAVPDSLVGEAMMYNVGLAADVRTNTLIVSGREEQVLLAQEIVSHLDKPGMAAKWPVRFHKLEHADAQRMAQMIDRLMSQRLQVLQRLGPASLERERVLVVADIRSNSLIILAKDDNYEEIVELAKKLDTTKDVAGDIRLITLDKTQANVIAPKLTQLWQRRMQLIQQGGGLRDTPVIVTDERSNSLIVASSKEDYEAIQTLVKTLEEAPLTPIADIRIIKLEHTDASTLSPTLQQLFQRRMQMRQTPGARPLPSDQVAVFPDPIVNALLVACSQENYDTLLELVKKLDVETPLEGVIKFFTLQHADATRVSQMIEQMFRSGLYKPGTLGKETAISRARDKIVVESDMRTNSIIVSASKENYAIIETLIKEIDVKESPFLEGNVKLFKVQYADAVKLSNMLEQVLQKMQSFRQRVGPELPVTVLPDEGSNTLIVSGSRDVLTQAGSLIEQLDKPSDEPTRELVPYALVHASAAKVAQILEDLFQERRGGRRGTEGTLPFVRADETANIVIVAASQEDHKVVEGLLKHIDIKSEAAQRMKIFTLQQAQAEDLQDVVQELYSQQRSGAGARGGRGAGPGISLSVDPQTNSLIVWAAPSEMEDIADLVDKLDTTNPRDETRVQIFRLKQADAEDLAEVLTEILGGRSGRATRRGGAADSLLISYRGTDKETGEEVIQKLIRRNVQIVPEPLTNSLVVRASPDSMAMLSELIEAIDGIPPREVDVRVFQLVNGDASQMVKVLEKLFKVGEEGRRRGRGSEEEETQLRMAGLGGGLGGEGGPPGRQLLSFTPDTRTNSVIAAGTEEYLLLAEKLIHQLDEQEIEERTNMVYEVKFSKAEDLEKALKTHYKNLSDLYKELDDEEAKLRQIEREVSVVADTTTESLLVSVSPRYESQVMKMIADLDRPPPQVAIKVLMAEVTLDDRVELGLEFAVQDLLFSETAYVGNNNMIKGNNFDFVAGTDLGAAGATGGGFSFTITGEDFNFLLRALQSEGRLEVLSRPWIVAEDNVEANISLGEDVPYVLGVSILSDGRTQTQVSYQQIGIILDVTPHINPDGYVSLEVRPEISNRTESTIPITEGVFAPVFGKREAKTTVTVKDGETIVIGGLITTEERDNETKIPILGDIPGLGALFRATVTSTRQTELLIVLTPVVVKNEREARVMSERARDEIDLLPENVRRSPLMEKLQVKPEDELLGPTEPAEEKQVDERPAPAQSKADRLDYGPSKPAYGPARPVLTSHEDRTPPKKMSAPDSYELYLRQRR